MKVAVLKWRYANGKNVQLRVAPELLDKSSRLLPLHLEIHWKRKFTPKEIEKIISEAEIIDVETRFRL